LEAIQPQSILASIESATYPLLEMDLCLHKRNQASFAGNFNDYSKKGIFHFKFIGSNVDFLPINFPFPLGGR
jgi:hypothetical protein